jgi:hypothetical protein
MISVSDGPWKRFIWNVEDLRFFDYAERMVSILYNQTADSLLDAHSIKYIVIPIRDYSNSDDFFIYYSKDRSFYERELDKLDYLHKVLLPSNGLIVYENTGYKDHIYISDQIEDVYKQIPTSRVVYSPHSPTHYSISLKSVNHPIYINFSESYHPDWSLRLGSFSSLKSIFINNYFYSDGFHFENNYGLNSFLIDPDYIKKELSSDSYSLNPDGSINLEMHLYFKSQSYVYLGGIITITTIVLSGLFLVCRSNHAKN